MSKGKMIALWVVSCFIAALFLFAGGMKLLKPVEMKAAFVSFGYAPWFATFIGVCEVLGGIGLLIPRLAALAAGCLSVIMIGVVYTVASHHQYAQAVLPVVVFVLLIYVCRSRITLPGAAQAQTASQGR